MKKKLFQTLGLALILVLTLGATAWADDDSDSDSDSDGRPSANIVEVAIAVNSDGPFAGMFDTLIAAVLAADPIILGTLTGRGQFTVFAPTDDAFAALGLDEATIGTAFSQQTLTQILAYHVARGRRDSGDILDSRRVRTLQGGRLEQSGGILTDALDRDATIIVTDVPASNGIIHVIDAVVLPFAP